MVVLVRLGGVVAAILALVAALCPRAACAQLAAVELDPAETAPDDTAARTRAIATWSLDAESEHAPRLAWRSNWRRFETGDAIFTGLMAAAGAATYFSPPSHESVQWRGGILFDDAARDAMLLTNPSSRESAAAVSDGLAIGLFSLPILIDAMLIAWAGHGSSDVAAQMLLIDLQAHAIAQGLTGIVKWAVRRERPIAAACREGSGECNGHVEPASFFSGHASLAFTSAALVCVHHTELGLLGEAGDAAACASALAIAGGVGALRIMADRHYASDVIVGAAVGLVSGWLLPYVLHYGALGGPNDPVQAAIAPTISRDQAGLQVVGSF